MEGSAMLSMILAALALLSGQDSPMATAPSPPPTQTPSPSAAAQPANAPPLARESDCQNAANRAEGESENACVFRYRRMGPTSTRDFAAYAEEVRARNETAQRARAEAEGRLDFDAALDASYGPTPEGAIPEWAFMDRARWERSQCGETPEEACLRTARNRLAMARAERTAAAPVERNAPGPERCRNVWTQATEGVGGSFSRVCGSDEAAGARLLEDMRQRDERTRQDAERDCVRRPVTTDQGVRWELACGSQANRERASDLLDGVMR